MLATYGLRHHEAFRLNRSSFPIIQVMHNTKTNFRGVWPCPLDWVELWNMKIVILLRVNPNQSNSDIGYRVSPQFRCSNIPSSPDDLRHAWAIRTPEWMWPVELSAQMMGHGVEVHPKT